MACTVSRVPGSRLVGGYIMTKLEEARKTIERINNSNPVKEAEANLKEAKAAQTEAEIRMEKAIASGNLKAHRKAKADYQAAAEDVNFYAAVQGGPLIADSEYRELVDGIRAETRAYKDQQQEKVVAILGDLQAIADDVRKVFGEADDILYRLQYDLGGNHSSEAFYTPGSDDRMKPADYGLLWYLDDILMRAKTAEIIS